MDYPKYGTYQAVVTDNSEFYKRGHIRVRVSVFYSGDLNWDLSKDYSEAGFSKDLKDDIKCLVYTPVGGGHGHGMFTLPQVNSIGMINFLDGNIKKAVWMGSFIRPEFDENGEFLKANVPNDDIYKEGFGNDGLTKDGKNTSSDGGAIIIRQKSTSSGDADTMNWDKNRTENLVVMSENDLKLTHVTRWEESDDKSTAKPSVFHEISISKNTDEASEFLGLTSINIKSFNINDNDTLDEFGIEIVNKTVRIKNTSFETKVTNTIDVTGKEMLLTSYDDNTKEETVVNVNPQELSLKNTNASVEIRKDEVNIFGDKKVTLSGKDIRLGGLAEEHVVTSNTVFSYRMEDGTVLTSSPVAKA